MDYRSISVLQFLVFLIRMTEGASSTRKALVTGMEAVQQLERI
jgi:hypothetical protein